MKTFTIRLARKSSHMASRVLGKSLHFVQRVENKTTRILSGTDYSVRAEAEIPLEKIYYNSLPYITPINPSLPAIGSNGAVVLFLPSLDGKSFYGGTATALVVAGRIAQIQKKKLKIIQTLKTGHPGKLSEFFKSEGLDIPESNIQVLSVADRKYNVYGYVSLHPDDVYIASAWWDAHLINQLPIGKKFIYLVQDFEPIFYNNSDLYILAENTYKLESFIPLCNTKLMYDFMRERKYPAFMKSDASWFEPAVSRLKSGPAKQKSSNEKRKLFLYGRPDVHRNMFFMALESIDYAFKAGFLNPQEWELFMAGQDNIPDIKLTSGVKIQNLGKMSMQDYKKFSKTIDLAISPMMAPHPNYPTLEFASIGAAVVTTKYANKKDLANYSKNIVISDISVESMAGAIKQAANLSHEKRMQQLKESLIESDWEKTLQKPLTNILKKLNS